MARVGRLLGIVMLAFVAAMVGSAVYRVYSSNTSLANELSGVGKRFAELRPMSPPARAAHSAEASMVSYAQAPSKQDTIKVLMKLGHHSNYNRYRWAVIRRLLMDERARDMASPFTFMDYSSGLGAISMAVAATFPSAWVLSLESPSYLDQFDEDGRDAGSSDDYVPPEAQTLGAPEYHRRLAGKLAIGNNLVCSADFKPSLLTSLRITGIVYDYQLLVGRLQHLALPTFVDLKAMIASLVRLAYVTVLEIPPKTAGRQYPQVLDWYKKGGDPMQMAKEAVRGLHAQVTFLVEHRGEGTLIQITNLDADNTFSPTGARLCQQLSSVFGCHPEMDQGSCAHVKHLKHSSPAKSSAMDGPSRDDAAPRNSVSDKDKPKEKPVEKKLRSIPRELCHQNQIMELIPGCGRRPQSDWAVENDGWYKCRNGTHWLTGCLRYQ